MRKKRTETTIEARQVFRITKPEASALAWCAECPGGQALMVAPEEAAVLASVPPRTIYRWVEGGTVHYTETPAGALLVCLDSLSLHASKSGVEGLAQ